MWWWRMRRILKSFGRDALVLFAACREPATPGWIRAAAIALLAYLVSPVDLVPDALLPIGWLDDITLLAIAIPFLLRRVPTIARESAALRAGRWLGRLGFRGTGAR